jgi:hypothetical protein
MQRMVVGIDGQRDLAGTTLSSLPQQAGGRESEVARAFAEKHEADHVSARFQRNIKCFRGLQSADFDREGHGAGSTA